MSSTQPIGGYFELELRQHGSLFHNNAIALNSGRNAFAYIIESLAVKKVYLPLYICPVMLQPLQQLQIDYAFYSINEDLEPDQNFAVGGDECILYINYFGLKNATAQKLAQNYANTVIDNAQAFFNLPSSHSATFYSPRKFFGVPDGGFAYTNKNSMIALRQDKTSFERCEHLLKRIDLGASEGFSDFKSHEQEFENRPIAGMSRLTKKMLLNIDYEWVRSKRNENFNELHIALQKFNQLSHIMDGDTISGPMMYPYLCDNKNLREHLHENNIFTPTYWPHISEMGNGLSGFESHLAEHMIPLPIDQRYGRHDMDRIVSVIEECNG
jgi:hypothetical protein